MKKKLNEFKEVLWTLHFGSMRFPLEGKLDFNLKNDFYLFLKGKQNKKENPKCDSLFWKRWSAKNRIGLGGQVAYQEGTVKTVAPL